jgi:hypothetical protein
VIAVAILVAWSADVEARARDPAPPGVVPVMPHRAGRTPCPDERSFGHAMQSWSRAYLEAVYLITDLVLPDVGVRHDTRDGAQLVLSWPWAFPFGPASATEILRFPCQRVVARKLVPYRFVIEAGVSIGTDATWWVRPGYSVVWHPRASRIGLTAGFGPTVALYQGRGEVFSSFELGLRYGACCRPGYAALTARYERSVLRNDGTMVRAAVLKLGLAYW